jgi:predicted RNA-binding Zn ribbon-like protein
MVGVSTELVGNALCLDFANSIDDQSDPRHDWLAEPDGLRSWAVLAGLSRPSRRPTDDDVAAAVALRDAIYRVFSAVAARKRPASRDLALITATAAEGLAAAVMTTNPVAGGASHSPTTYKVEWRCGDARRVLWAIADSASELLRHGPLDRIGECPSCGWVFLDTSRNGHRRWCSMAMCGNAVKYARHQARTTAARR